MDIYDDGTEVFLDVEQMRVYRGLVYFTYLNNNLKPNDELGTLSETGYVEGNCATLGYRLLSTTFYKQQMARGGERGTFTPENPELKYAAINSIIAGLIGVVCGRYNLN